MSKQIDSQRLRNLTTHRLHTKMDDIYKDLEWLYGVGGLMTHMLPNMLEAATPWLRKYVRDEKYWDSEYDVSHVETFILPDPLAPEREQMWDRYRALPSPFIR